VDVAFNTKYYADEYMPATSQFYIQNEKQIGNYPYIDLFLNAKIKRANIFVKLQHATEGLLGKTYYSIPNYPLQGRAIKFGVCWKFYD
jgi:outer membrane cobalamin receptor